MSYSHFSDFCKSSGSLGTGKLSRPMIFLHNINAKTGKILYDFTVLQMFEVKGLQVYYHLQNSNKTLFTNVVQMF